MAEEVKKKHAGGRPPKTTADLPVDWQSRARELMMEGASQSEIMREIFIISRETYYKLLKDDTEFANVIKEGKELSKGWWEAQGRMIRDDKMNSTLWYMNMKNRFGWKDKQESELTGKDGAPLFDKVSYKIEDKDES